MSYFCDFPAPDAFLAFVCFEIFTALGFSGLKLGFFRYFRQSFGSIDINLNLF